MKLRSIITKSQLKPIKEKAMKEKEYKEEIIRLENVLLEKEKTIQDLQDKLHLLYLQKYNKKYNLINIQKDYFKNPNNEAIYNTLIFILQTCFIFKPLGEWNPEELKIDDKIVKKLIEQLENERDLNND